MAKNTEKDKRMAAELKRRNVSRSTGCCPICYKIVANVDMLNHMRAHSYQG